MKLAAIRYLGGVLELPTFWSKQYYPLQRFAATRLFSRTVELIEDLNMEGESPEHETDVDSADIEGLDMLSTSILVGTKTWITRLGAASVANECWFQSFVQFLSQFYRCGYESGAPIPSGLYILVAFRVCFCAAQRRRLSFRMPGFVLQILSGTFPEQK